MAFDRFEDIVKSAEDAIELRKDRLLFLKGILQIDVSGSTQLRFDPRRPVWPLPRFG